MIFRREPIHKKLARQARLDLAPEAGLHPEPVDPGPNWGEVGIHGVSRPRRWDAVGSVEAALQLELVGHDFFVFRSDESGDVNVIYRRRDGGYGLIDPQG